MVFMNRRCLDYTNFTLTLDKIPVEVEHKSVAHFLGVVIDDKLTWTNHIQAIKTKMSCYVGILYKLKFTLPITARKNIYHSFVQSYLNCCSLIWRLASKSNIDTLFTAQKKGNERCNARVHPILFQGWSTTNAH